MYSIKFNEIPAVLLTDGRVAACLHATISLTTAKLFKDGVPYTENWIFENRNGETVSRQDCNYDYKEQFYDHDNDIIYSKLWRPMPQEAAMEVASVNVGDTVIVASRVNGYKTGKVTWVNPYKITTDYVAVPGDSGSLVTINNKIVGFVSGPAPNASIIVVPQVTASSGPSGPAPAPLPPPPIPEPVPPTPIPPVIPPPPAPGPISGPSGPISGPSSPGGPILTPVDPNIVNVLDWGVKNDGTTPCSSLINSAFAWAKLNNKKNLYIPPGKYAIESPIYIRDKGVRLINHGYLKNIDGNNKEVLIVSVNVNDHGPTINNGVPVYELNDIVIDGQGLGTIDQNSQKAKPFNAENSDRDCGHSIICFGVNSLTIKNLTLKNSILWALTVELCKNVEVSECKVFTGFCNNRMVSGRPSYLGGQDGIHLHDCLKANVFNNEVESGDDAVVVSSSRTIAGDTNVYSNKAKVKVFAYEADGVTLNNNSVSGRFALAAYISSVSNCSLDNVIFRDNIISGGQGLFCAYDESGGGQSHLKNIKFIGNIFDGQNSPGNPAVVPAPISFGWYVNNVDSLEITNNTFNNIARKGVFLGNNRVVVVKSNRFSNFGESFPKQLYPEQPETILWALKAKLLIIEGNLFENNKICPIGFGSMGDFTPNVLGRVIVKDNIFLNNNTRWAASAVASNTYSACVYANGVTNLIFSDNIVDKNYGNALVTRACQDLKVQRNSINNIGNGSFKADGDAIRILNLSNNYGGQTDITDNICCDIDGNDVVYQNVRQINLLNNVSRNKNRGVAVV